MRRRLVSAFVGLTIVVIALYGIPRAYVLADLVRSQEQSRVDRTAALVAVAVEERWQAGRTVDPGYLDELTEEGESILVRPEDGTPVQTAGRFRAEDGDVWATADVDGGGTVTVNIDDGAVSSKVAQALLPLVLLGLGLVLLAGAAGAVMARWFARPFQDLAAAASDLGLGHLRPDLPDYRVPEAREIATALVSSGEKLDALLRHERALAVHASHELRTPVTALRLELEDLALWPETPPTVAAELQRSVGELDRLSEAITGLLSTSQDQAAESEVELDLDDLVTGAVARAVAAGRPVTHVANGPLPTRVDPLPVDQALDLLLVSGSRVTTADRGTHLEITIAGEAGAAVRTAGTEGAPDLVAAAGGHLTRTADGVLIRIPKRPHDGA